MEFISSEEFLRQTKEVQEVFMEWWKPSIGDLYCDNAVELKCILGSNMTEWINTDKVYKKYFPLLTEGQLRKFIEDKTKYKAIPDLYGNEEYYISLFKWGGHCFIDKEDSDFYNLGNDLLQAYWKVACEIAKESFENE